MPYLCLWRRNFCAAGDVLFGYSGAIFERLKSLFSLTTATQNIHVFLRKSPLLKEHFFEWLKTANFLNRLRNGHLEKSAATGLFRPSRSPMTAKVPLKVHLRLRFQNPGKPRTAGLCGRAAGACDCGPLSCAKIERPLAARKTFLKSSAFRSKPLPANIVQKSYRLQRRPQPLPHRVFSTSRTNGPRLLSLP